MMAATETMRPPSRWRKLGGVAPERGPFAGGCPVEEGADPLVDVLESLETVDVEMPVRPIACTRSSTRRVETPPIQAS
jgi:hypothetical protein